MNGATLDFIFTSALQCGCVPLSSAIIYLRVSRHNCTSYYQKYQSKDGLKATINLNEYTGDCHLGLSLSGPRRSSVLKAEQFGGPHGEGIEEKPGFLSVCHSVCDVQHSGN